MKGIAYAAPAVEEEYPAARRPAPIAATPAVTPTAMPTNEDEKSNYEERRTCNRARRKRAARTSVGNIRATPSRCVAKDFAAIVTGDVLLTGHRFVLANSGL